jgi:hypothetical protein
MSIASASAAAARFVAESMLLIVLAASPSTGRSPDVHERVAEDLEQRARAGHERLRAAEHDRERAGLGAGQPPLTGASSSAAPRSAAASARARAIGPPMRPQATNATAPSLPAGLSAVPKRRGLDGFQTG